jgi:hypothetical protein
MHTLELTIPFGTGWVTVTERADCSVTAKGYKKKRYSELLGWRGDFGGH